MPTGVGHLPDLSEADLSPTVGQDASLTDLAEQLQHRMMSIRDTQRRLQEVSCTATGRRRAVSVTAGHGGTVQAVTFRGEAYRRMTPTELSEVVLSTIRKAQDLAVEECARVLAPDMPEGLDAGRLLRGDVDLRDLLPSSGSVDDALRDTLSAVPEGGRP